MTFSHGGDEEQIRLVSQLLDMNQKDGVALIRKILGDTVALENPSAKIPKVLLHKAVAIHTFIRPWGESRLLYS